MIDRGLLVVLSGPSGVGKDTILNEFFRSNGEGSMLSISVTTRRPRNGEKDGADYFFVSRSEFERMIENQELLEYAQYSGNLYGTPRKAVEQWLASGWNVVLEIELKGAMQVKSMCPDAVFVFVMPPSLKALRERLEHRGTESSESIDARMLVAETELRMAGEYDYIIVNHAVAESSKTLEAIITAAGCAVKYNKDIAMEVLEDA